jgi:hypothetical protein
MLQRMSLFEKSVDFLAAKSPDVRRASHIFDEWMRRLKKGEEWSEKITLTPPLAQLLLNRNDGNRHVSETRVQRFVQDIREGRWETNGEPIIVASTGELNDGQHRCTSVCRAATPIQTWITFGVNRESRLTVDQGGTKTTGDYLQMDGVANSNEIAAMARMLWQYDTLSVISGQPEKQPTKGQLLELAAVNLPALSASLAAVPKKGSAKVGGLSFIAFAHYLFTRSANADAATEFLSKVVKGEKLSSTDPAHAARERLLEERLRRAPLSLKVEIICRAWLAHQAKRRMSRIQTNGSIPRV